MSASLENEYKNAEDNTAEKNKAYRALIIKLLQEIRDKP